MSANKEDTMRQFCDVTGTDENRSRFFLESSNWQLDVALSSFYEHGGNLDEAPTSASAPVSVPQVLTDSDMESPPTSPQKKKDKKKTSNTNFATLNTLQQESSSDEEEGQAFYAGGSERSGQQIIGPGKNRKDIVTEMFKSVRERGAVVFEDEPSTAGRSRGAFSGVGYRLGQTSDDHEQVSVTNPQTESTGRSVRLRLYREGFTVDDGAVRHYSDPQNAEFLRCIRQGEIPPELSFGGGEVRVSLEDRRMEECPRNASKTRAFAGKGHLLGSPTPVVTGAAAPAPSAPPPGPGHAPGPAPGPVPGSAPPPSDRAANTRAAQDAVALDGTQPVTTVQFRLADGSLVVGRFNPSHTVSDLSRFVSACEPAYQRAPFALLTSYPSAELRDPALSLQQAGLLNSTLLLRLK